MPNDPPRSNASTFVPGRLLADRYELLRPLGRGGVGAVWLARNVRVDKQVAIKTVHERWSRDTNVRERFKGEALAANRTSHPNIVQVFDADETAKGELYLVMEFVDGKNLHELQRDHGTFTLQQAHTIMKEVCSAIAAAHSVGVIHRDLKPENIMVAGPLSAPTIKVMDFGIAAQMRQAEADSGGARMTAPGVRIGTPHYMAPEQGGSSQPDPRLDVYSLGVILFELLTGVLPFDHEDPMQILAQKLARPAPSLTSLGVKGIPPAVGLLVDAALSTDPRARPPDASVFLASLNAAVESYGDHRPISPAMATTPRVGTESLEVGAGTQPGRDSGETPPDTFASVVVDDAPNRQSPLVLVLLALLFLGFGAAGAWFALQPEQGPPPPLAQVAPSPAPAEEPARAPSDETSSTTEAEPEPAAPEAKPEVAPKPATTPKPSKAVTKKSAPKATTPLPELETPPPETTESKPPAHDKCLRVPDRARDARNAHDWPTLLRLAKKRSCFKSQSDRIKLLTKAYLELKRFEDCAKAGADSGDSEVQRWVKICQARSK